MKSKFLNILKDRGFTKDYTDEQGLDDYLSRCEESQTPAIAYIGFDCTAESLHIGSLLQIMALRHFQNCGHKPIILLGGGTTKIGDPSGKDESRKMLTDEQIEKNKAGIKKVFDKFIEFEDDFDESTNKALLVDNDEWLGEKNYIKFLREIGTHFSINRMLTMESVKRRLKDDSEMSFIEFNYMILQAYDFTKLADKYDCRLQIGGSDQWGNIVNGTDLNKRLPNSRFRKFKREEIEKLNNCIKPYDKFGPNTYSEGNKEDDERLKKKNALFTSRLQSKSLFGLTTPLLTTANGAKMGKSADGAVWLNDDMFSAYDFWQYWRNVDDADIERFFKYFTDIPVNKIPDLKNAEGAKINSAKIKLANEVTTLTHGKKKAILAEETAKKVFEQGGVSDDLHTITVDASELEAGITAMDLFVKAELCESNGEVKRLVKGGGAKVNDNKLNSHSELINNSHLIDGKIKLSAGKKKHALVEAK